MLTKLLTDKCAIVTGGAQGIGAGIAASLISHGAKVAIIDVQKEKIRATAAKLNVIPIIADITNAESCIAAVSEAFKALGGLDILVNNAAPNRDRAMIGKLDISDDWDKHSKLVIECVPRIIETAQKFMMPGSSVVNISSIIGDKVGLDQCSWSYHVSKSGLDHLTRWLACRLGSAGIRVNAVSPALIDREVGRKLTDDIENKKIIEEIVPLGRVGRADDIGQAVAFLSSHMASYITGQIINVDGGVGVMEPWAVASKVAKLQKYI